MLNDDNYDDNYDDDVNYDDDENFKNTYADGPMYYFEPGTQSTNGPDDFLTFEVKAMICKKSNYSKDLKDIWLEISNQKIKESAVKYNVEEMATFIHFFGKYMSLTARKLCQSEWGSKPTFPIQMALIRSLICEFFLTLERTDIEDMKGVPPNYFVTLFVTSMLTQLSDSETAFRKTSRHKDYFEESADQ